MEAMSVMGEAILEDVDVEEEGSGAEDGVDRDGCPWGVIVGVGSVELVVGEEEGIVCEGSPDPGAGSGEDREEE